jgi:hypothetical protein
LHEKAERLSTYCGNGELLSYAKDTSKNATIGILAQVFTGFDYYVFSNFILVQKLIMT